MRISTAPRCRRVWPRSNRTTSVRAEGGSPAAGHPAGLVQDGASGVRHHDYPGAGVAGERRGPASDGSCNCQPKAGAALYGVSPRRRLFRRDDHWVIQRASSIHCGSAWRTAPKRLPIPSRSSLSQPWMVHYRRIPGKSEKARQGGCKRWQ